MKKPMVTLQTKISFSQTLQRVLEFHLDEGATIVDPTPGKKHSWQYYLKEIKKPSLLPISNFNVVFIEDDITSFALTTGWANKPGLLTRSSTTHHIYSGHHKNRIVACMITATTIISKKL